MAKTVVGNYANTNDAMDKINALISEGYPVDSISVIANKAAAAALKDTGVTVERDFEYVEGTTDETLWERIKAFFGREDTKLHEASMSGYRDSILDGNVLVLVDEALAPMTLTDRAETAAAHSDYEDEETLRLREERMQVDKRPVQAGEAILHKRVVEETKTVDVPVWHEELVIERRAVNDEAASDVNFDDETITIPLMQEEIEVTTRPVVTGEVKVHKRDVENVEKVSASLRKEELEVDRDGNTIIVDETIAR